MSQPKSPDPNAGLRLLLAFDQYFPFLSDSRPAPLNRRWSYHTYRPKLFFVVDHSLIEENLLPIQPIGALLCLEPGTRLTQNDDWLHLASRLCQYFTSFQDLFPQVKDIGILLQVRKKDLPEARLALRHFELSVPYFNRQRNYFIQAHTIGLPVVSFKLTVLDFLYNKVKIPHRHLHFCALLGHGKSLNTFYPDSTLQVWSIKALAAQDNNAYPENHPILHLTPNDSRLLTCVLPYSSSSARLGLGHIPEYGPSTSEVVRDYLGGSSSCQQSATCHQARSSEHWVSLGLGVSEALRIARRAPLPLAKRGRPVKKSASVDQHSENPPGPSGTSETAQKTGGPTSRAGPGGASHNEAFRASPELSAPSASAKSPLSTGSQQGPGPFSPWASDNPTSHSGTSSLPSSDQQGPPSGLAKHFQLGSYPSPLSQLGSVRETTSLSSQSFSPPAASMSGNHNSPWPFRDGMGTQPLSKAELGPGTSSSSPTRTNTHSYRFSPYPNPFLMGLLLILLMLPATMSLTFKEATFMAYDCSKPENKTAVRAPGHQQCQISEPIDQKNRTYTLLQRAKTARIPGQACYMTQTRLVFKRGVYDHAIISPHMTVFHQPTEITVKQCEAMWKSEKYEDPSGTKHELLINGSTLVQYYFAGKCGHNDDRTDLACVGEKYNYKNKDYPGMVVSVQLDIVMRHEELVVQDRDRTVMVHRTQTILPCRAGTGGCTIPAVGTIAWDAHALDSYCPFYKLRIVQGIDVTDKQGDILFLSQDGSMVRLEKGKPLSQCREVLFETQYPQLFLTENLEHREFNRPLHPSELSTITYANQQDSFLFGELTALIKREYSAVRHKLCLQRNRQDKGAYARAAAEQKVLRDGETVYLGEGVFALASGEVWYRYQCRPLQVVAINKDRCYDALPVRLSKQDEERYYLEHQTRPSPSPSSWTTPANHTLNQVETEFFLEPHSHLLITVASPMPCTPEFAPVYKNAYGHHIVVSPSLRRVPEPRAIYQFDQDQEQPLVGQASDYDFHQGGIYTPESVAQMENYARAPRASRTLAGRLAAQIQDSHVFESKRPLLSSDLFDDIPSFSTLLPFLPLWNFLLKWGSLCSALFGIVAIIRIFTWLGGLVCRLITDFPAVGCSFKLCLVCCPSARDLFYTQYHSKLSKLSLRHGWNKLKQKFQGPTTPTITKNSGLYPQLPPASSPPSNNLEMHTRRSTLPADGRFPVTTSAPTPNLLPTNVNTGATGYDNRGCEAPTSKGVM